jgi:hypothetical protein
MSDHEAGWTKEAVYLFDKADQVWDVFKHLVGVDDIKLCVLEWQAFIEIGDNIHARKIYTIDANGSRQLMSSATDIQHSLPGQ